MKNFLLKNSGLLLVCIVFLSSCVTQKKFKLSESERQAQALKLEKAKADSIALQTMIADLNKKLDDEKKDRDSLERKLNTRSLERSVVTKTNALTITKEDEYQKKALLIYGFIKNIEWENEFTKGDFIIGVFGSSPIYDKLKTEVEGKKAGNQMITIKQFTTTNNLTNCHIIFVTNPSYSRISAIREKISKFPTLIVAEEDYLKNDTHINLVVDGRTVKYNVNKESMNKARLKASSKLVTMAE